SRLDDGTGSRNGECLVQELIEIGPYRGEQIRQQLAVFGRKLIEHASQLIELRRRPRQTRHRALGGSFVFDALKPNVQIVDRRSGEISHIDITCLDALELSE